MKKKTLLQIVLALSATLTLFVGCTTAPPVVSTTTSAPVVNATPPTTEITESQSADIVLKNGIIQTMVKETDVAQSVAIIGDEIVYVGDDTGVQKFVGTNTKVIDLAGQMVIPGFMDGHMHSPATWLDALFAIDISKDTTNDAYIQTAKTFIAANPELEAYTGAPFSLNVYKKEDGSNPGPIKEDLDALSLDKPIMIFDVSRHSAWVNSKALELGGITKDTKNPDGGIIARKADGEPSGYLTDSAVNLVTDVVKTTYSDEMFQEAITTFLQEANSYGITGITNIVGAATLPYVDPQLYSKLESDNKLTLRMRFISTINPGTTIEEAVTTVKNLDKYNSEMLSNGTAKLFYDGVTESGTAVMLEPYLPEAGKGDNWYGEPVWNELVYDEMVAGLDAAGIQVHTHAIGDGAVKKTLDSYDAAITANGDKGLRHTMTHVCAIAPEDIPRLSKLGVVSSLQFLWMYKDPLFDLEAAFIGNERATDMYPVKTMVEAGAIVSGASDAPITGYNPLEEIEVGVTRNSPFAGEEDTDMYRDAEQALTAYQMLEVYTKNVAYQNFMEKNNGTIEVGKKADMAVLSQNILTIAPKAISDTQIMYTIFNGNIVYQK